LPPALSLIIPTHKRAAILKQCLERIERQTVADRLEVIVVSDGHDDETARLFETANPSSKIPIRFFEIPKSQQGVARNKGVAEATGEFVMFVGDDIFLAPDACEKHLKILNSQFSILNSAVLGFVTWDPACGITPVMRWLEKSGWQFGYPMIARYGHHFVPEAMQQRFTYTNQLSVPKKIAKKFPFREDVTLYGWEDIEWGWKLRKAGVKLFYEPDAKALHHHHMEMNDSLRRMETLGRSAVMMDRVTPDLKLVPHGKKMMKYRIAAMLPGMHGRHAKAFLRGIDNK